MLDYASFLEHAMGAALIDGFDGAGGESKGYGLFELWNVDALLLQVGVLAHHACGVELGSTSPVGVATSNS